MYVVEVRPLIRGTRLETLSYFSRIEYPVGTLLRVPIRKQEQLALVEGVRAVSQSKTALKAALFTLKKLPAQDQIVSLPDSLRLAAAAYCETQPTTVAAVLFETLPPDIRTGASSYPVSIQIPQQEETTPQLLVARRDERLTTYQSLIRTTFARQKSVLLLVPTPAAVEQLKRQLEHGITDRVITLSSGHTKRQRDNAYKALQDAKKAQLIIATPGYGYLTRGDTALMIIEQSSSSSYRGRRRPYLDHRKLLVEWAKASGRALILGDTVPLTEDEYASRINNYLVFDEPVKRLVFGAPLQIITQTDKTKPNKPFALFSPVAIEAITTTLAARGRVFLYAARRGLAPLVTCVDCGYIFRCSESNTPYSLLRTTKDGKEQRWFVSSTSGRKLPAADICSRCGSWRLRERGIGVQAIYDEWQKRFPDTSATLLDSDSCRTYRQAEHVARKFFASEGGVLIGTQVALPFLEHNITTSIVMSLDAARSIPTWRADEQLFRLLLELREQSTNSVLVQTRTEPDDLLEHASRGALEKFYTEEIALREQLNYPPFTVFYLLSWNGVLEEIRATELLIKKTLPHVEITCYSSPQSTNDKLVRHALIRYQCDKQSTLTTLMSRLRSLPAHIKVEVDPARIV